MNTLPIAEETYTKVTGCIINHKDVKTAMIEFAKLHVEAALKAASKKGLVEADEGGYTSFVDKESILNAYPLDNIK